MARMRILPAGQLQPQRHCGPMRGSAKPSRFIEKGWIASELTLLAMTVAAHHTIIVAKSFKAHKDFLFETASETLP
jgi:hypothetical protein